MNRIKVRSSSFSHAKARESLAGRLTACGLLLFSLLFWGLSPVPLWAGDIVGSDAPDFSLADLQGNTVQLSKIRDKPVVLVHMQVYCHTCREEVPLINQIYREYKNVRVLAVAVGNDSAEVSDFIKAFHAEFPILPDPQKQILKRYFLSTVPLIDLIDKSGTIRYRGKLHSMPEFKSILEDLLKDKEMVGSDLWNKPPDFTLPNSEGGEFHLGDHLGQKTLLLSFFSPRDETIHQVIEIMKSLYVKYKREDIDLVRVAVGSTAEEVNIFKKRYYVNFPILVDMEGKVAQRYHARDQLRSFIINKSGKIRFVTSQVSLGNIESILRKARTYFREDLSEEELFEYLKKVAPEAKWFERIRFGGHTLYYGQTQSGEKFFIREVFKDILCDVCTNIHYVYSFDPSGKVKNIVMIENIDLYGMPVEGKDFLDRIVAASNPQQPLHLKKEIDGITGATQSSKLILEGINETPEVLEALKKHQDLVKNILN
ncbi:MAG: redoxin domain-containing protein [Candidatus Tectomicrobia bacterium]|uniref:Redoxin domain-containing protein n=1 Tax=Tectimicrobiota bacterium TaxID=2528274 RepID=A0A932FUS9_UNCTE|nr:redoxin domain-containing protein [Candidatus Tectomicrobia bacterium]